MLISTPVALPKVEVSDWPKFWSIWNIHGRELTKVRASPNAMSGKHFGFDILRTPGFFPTYAAPLCNLDVYMPELYRSIINVLPLSTRCVRLVESRGDFPAHYDNFVAAWSLRCMLYCADPKPQWYYTPLDSTSQTFLRLPEQTNWWAYRDGAVKHGTMYNPEYPKILIQVFGDFSVTKKLVDGSAPLFEHEYKIHLDETTNELSCLPRS